MSIPSSIAAHLGECFIGGRWVKGDGPVSRPVPNPANVKEIVSSVQEASIAQVDACVEAAHAAFPGWASTPAPERARVMFRFRELLEKNVDELATMIVLENGKTLLEAKGDVRRGIDVVEFCCGAPSLMMGLTLPDISHGVDASNFREPLGVCVGLPPFNFPAMIPLWHMAPAVAFGNCFVLKPSEKCPLTGTRVVELLHEAGVPAGVISCVQGGREVSERLLTHPLVQAIAFVGSTPVAASVYEKGCAAGKRVLALGGAKNHLIVMPDAELEGKNGALNAIIGSGYGCAGQRCLAGSVVVAVGDQKRQDEVSAAIVNAAKALRMGSGLDPKTTLGPVANEESLKRVANWIEKGAAEGAKLLLDGRTFGKPEGFADGCFLGPSVLELPDTVTPKTVPSVGQEEVFGPVLVVVRAKNLDEAIAFSNESRFGNSASIFTNDAAAIRIFKLKIHAAMLGVGVGVPAPMAYNFSFRGSKASAFGSHGAYGLDSVEFFTFKKVVSERHTGSTMAKLGWV